MKLKNVAFANYRNFRKYSIELGKMTTVLIGRNGMGKSNLLAGMVQSLSFIFSKQRNVPQYEFIKSSSQSVRSFAATDPYMDGSDYCYSLSISCDGYLNGSTHPVHWAFEQESEKSGLKDSKFRQAYHQFWEYYNACSEKPVLAYFSDAFPHKESKISSKMNEKLDSGKPLPSNTAYYQWDNEQSCAQIWRTYFVQEWFNRGESEDKQEFIDAINRVFRTFTNSLESVENPDFIVKELYGRLSNQKPILMVRFDDGRNIPFRSLPAGYLRIFSIVLDIACRSYLLNKHCDAEGIVMIDEIDLHLHPSLAAEILPRLRKTFSRVQFIITTHSPMVITSYLCDEDNYLYKLLRDESGYVSVKLSNQYGLDYSIALHYTMDTPEQYAYLQNLKSTYQFWKGRNCQDIMEKIKLEIIKEVGEDSQFYKTLDV